MLQPVKPRALRRLIAQLASPARRGVALPLAAMLLGLIFAGMSLFHHTPVLYTSVPPGYVALVNQQGILMSDFISETATDAEVPFDQTTPAQRAQVLHQMIDRELQVQRALVLGLPETTVEVRRVMGDAVEAQAAAPVEAMEPSEAQLRAYYDAHRARYSSPGQMTVRNLVLHVGGYQNADQTLAQADADAVEAVYQLRSGAAIDYIMEHFGFVDADPAYSNTQQLDFAARIHLGDKLFQVASGMSGGQVSDPIDDADGVHVLVMMQRLPTQPQDFPAARATVYNDYRIAQKDLAIKNDLQFLRSQAQILLAPGQTE